MSEKVIGNQYLFNGPGYLDAKIQPVEHVEDLDKILLRQRFIGLTVTVIHPDGDNSSPADYWLRMRKKVFLYGKGKPVVLKKSL